MSDQFEQRLDLALDARQQRLRQKPAERAAAEMATSKAQVARERMQRLFCGRIRSPIEHAVEGANRHLVKRPENCQLRDVSGYVTGSIVAAGTACNSVASGRTTGPPGPARLRMDARTRAGLWRRERSRSNSSLGQRGNRTCGAGSHRPPCRGRAARLTAAQWIAARTAGRVCDTGRRPGVLCVVEERRGDANTLRFPSPLIKLAVPVSGIQLSDRFHLATVGIGLRWTRRKRCTPGSPNTAS